MMNEEFKDIVDKFIRLWATVSPQEAFGQGMREYAGFLADYSPSQIQTYLLFLRNIKKELDLVNVEILSKEEHVNYLVLLNKIDSLNYEIVDSNALEINPLAYSSAAFVFDYLLKAYAPLDQRLDELIVHLNQLPKFYETAKNNLVIENIAPENSNMAILMLSGIIEFLSNLKSEVKEIAGDEILPNKLLEEIEIASKTGGDAVKSFVDFLISNKDNFKGSFRLGEELFSKMLFKNERVDLSISEILKAGEKNLERNWKEFIYAASQIDENKNPSEIIKDIKLKHPTAESLFSDTQNMLVDIRQFLIDSEFVTVPSEVIPKVIPTPKAFRQWAFAAMDTPGALEKKATDSYYYISPPDENWTEEEKEDWLQTFNYPGLLDISVHEAFPGHFLHNLHNQRTKMLVAKLFGAYHFWEGYALYVEEAMWEHGFQKGDYEYRMAQLIETLLRNVRLICSIKLHTDPNFSVEDATNMFMEKVFMGRKPAESEAQRGTFDPGYLNYALGKLMIEKLREDYKKEKGAEYKIKTFHDELLSFGAPPVPLLRKFMLKSDDGKIL
ncbi:MAG: hypothetical protein HeimC2_04110 [Candidatus Heimdallarchaeota archaeon LC_2]|nr:MAG: hypothetical protein HeimC2_04110 [Candidatus Heimdallarchaeota archaeon LC_2]